MKLFDFEGDTDSKGMGHVGIKARKMNKRNEWIKELISLTNQ